MLAPVAFIVLHQSSPLEFKGQDLPIREVLAITTPASGGRVPFPIDPIAYRIAKGSFTMPTAGLEETFGGTAKRTWRTVQVDKDGWLSGAEFEGGYAACKVFSSTAQVAMLHTLGNSLTYVNGIPRVGDPYSFGYVSLPIQLQQGENNLLFPCGRGRLKAELLKAPDGPALNLGDLTLPDQLRGVRESMLGSVVVTNPTPDWCRNAKIQAGTPGGTVTEDLPPLPPLSVRKVNFRIPSTTDAQAETIPLSIKLIAGKHTDAQSTTLRVKNRNEIHKETFVSEIDGSVQYYAVVPPTKIKPNLAMVLSLHGASVEALNQANSYSQKDWCWIVCPTNRRPYGFDWEDWGRQDGLEVLQIAKQRYKTAPEATYLTGHSMGGHGTWQLGALFPDKFAAIGPSAGWASFFTYTGAPRKENPAGIEAMLQRANGTSNTLDFLHNYKPERVYILHGDADDNVPVTEARNMKEKLQPFVTELGYHEQKGAGHWWDGDASPGADCVDWPEMFEMFKRSKLVPMTSVDFTTSNLRVSDSEGPVRILQQIRPLEPSRVQLKIDSQSGNAEVTTQNVQALEIDTRATKGAQALVIDGAPIPPGKGGVTTFVRTELQWRIAPKSFEARPQVGPFKRVFDQRPVLVYGTTGSAEENLWSYSKAIYDSETFWYRGNASFDVVSDKEFLHGGYAGRNVVLYGNADTNALWERAFKGAQLQAGTGTLKVGDRSVDRESTAYAFIAPIKGRDTFAGAVGGTDLVGMRATYRLPFFSSGVGYPDWTVFSVDAVADGMKGVIGAGYYGGDGTIANGDQAWSD